MQIPFLGSLLFPRTEWRFVLVPGNISLIYKQGSVVIFSLITFLSENDFHVN